MSDMLPRLDTDRDFDAADQGWMVAADGSERVRSGVLAVDLEKVFAFQFAPWSTGSRPLRLAGGRQVLPTADPSWLQ